MKMNELDMEHVRLARPVSVFQLEPGRRGAIAAFKARLVKAWVGLYAPPPRRLRPLI